MGREETSLGYDPHRRAGRIEMPKVEQSHSSCCIIEIKMMRHEVKPGGVTNMTMTKTIMGLAVGVSLLVGFEPMAMALPVAAPQNVVGASDSNDLVVKTVTRAGVAHRSARRTTRRVVRRH